MKRFFIITFLVLSLCVGVANARDWVDYSGSYTADANAIVSVRGFLFKIIIMTDGTKTVTFDIYDSLTIGTGSKMIPTIEIPKPEDAAAKQLQVLTFDPPVKFENGVSVDITTDGASYEYMIYTRY